MILPSLFLPRLNAVSTQPSFGALCYDKLGLLYVSQHEPDGFGTRIMKSVDWHAILDSYPLFKSLDRQERKITSLGTLF